MNPDARLRPLAIALHSHPPERRRRPSTVAACGCCCCCCCLHSVGGLLATAFVARSKTEEERKGAAAYWLCLLAGVALTGAASIADGDDGTQGLLIVILLLPGYQLGASLVAAIIALFCWGPEAMRRVGRLAWRGFLGGLIGLGIMLSLLLVIGDSASAMSFGALGVIIVLCFLYSLFRRLQRVRP